MGFAIHLILQLNSKSSSTPGYEDVGHVHAGWRPVGDVVGGDFGGRAIEVSRCVTHAT